MKTNLIFQIFYQILIIITPFITSPYVSRVLGAGGLGVYSYTYSIANYLMIFAMLGTNTYGSRSVASVKDDKKKLSQVFSEIYIFQIILTLTSCIVYIIYLFASNSENYLISAIQLILIISCFFNINWFFFGIEEFKVTVTRNIIIKVISIVAIFTFVKYEEDLWKYVLILALSELLSQIMLIYFARKKIKFILPELNGVLKHIKPNFVLFIPGVAFSINNLLDKSMLGWFSDYYNTGLYYSAEKLINIPMGIITGIGTVMLPRITNMISNGNDKKINTYLYNTIFLINALAIAMAFGIASIAPEFIPLFLGDGFDECIQLVQLMSLLIMIRAISNVIRTQYLIPHRLDKIYSYAMFYGALVNVILNLIFIKLYGAIGAVISTIISESIVCIYQNVITEKHISIIKKIFKSYIFIASGVLMYIGVRVIAKMLPISNIIVRIFVEIFIGILIYSVISIILTIILYKNEFEWIKVRGKSYEV